MKLPWDGPGDQQLRLSWDALERRNEQLAVGDMMARSLMEAVRNFYDTEGGLDPESMKAKLKKLVGAPDGRGARPPTSTRSPGRSGGSSSSSGRSRRRTRTAAPIPGIDAALVARRAAAIRSGAVKKALSAQVDGYRDLALGLVAYLDGDNFGALERVRNAAARAAGLRRRPRVPRVDVLPVRPEGAPRSPRGAARSSSIPTNKAVADALKEHGRAKRQTDQVTRAAGKDQP